MALQLLILIHQHTFILSPEFFMSHFFSEVMLFSKAICIILISGLAGISSQTVDPGEALFLTPLINSGRIDQAQKSAIVEDLGQIRSYSGFITVNETANSNIFFWYFPALESYDEPDNQEKYWNNSMPVVLWNDGGPGASLFFSSLQIGPFKPDASGKNITKNEFTWNRKQHMIFIDNPVEVGYSFTEDEGGLVFTDDEAARDIHLFLLQFFKLFPHLKQNPFFNSGVSYGGKYAVNAAYKLHQQNKIIDPENRINLKGIYVDGPAMELAKQLYHGDFLFNAGLLTENMLEAYHSTEDEIRRLLIEENNTEATLRFMQYGQENAELTGFQSFVNIYTEHEAWDMSPWVTDNATRKALHAGSRRYLWFGVEQQLRMAETWPRSTIAKLNSLLENDYKLAVTVGNLDGIINHLGVQNCLKQLTWEGGNGWFDEEREIWRVGERVAGYLTRSRNNQAIFGLIRNAGHSTFVDQPEWLRDFGENFYNKNWQ